MRLGKEHHLWMLLPFDDMGRGDNVSSVLRQLDDHASPDACLVVNLRYDFHHTFLDLCNVLSPYAAREYGHDEQKNGHDTWTSHLS